MEDKNVLSEAEEAVVTGGTAEAVGSAASAEGEGAFCGGLRSGQPED